MSGGHGRPALGVLLLLGSLAAARIAPLEGLPIGGYVAVACVLAGSVMLLPLLAGGLARLLPTGGPVPARLAAARLSS